MGTTITERDKGGGYEVAKERDPLKCNHNNNIKVVAGGFSRVANGNDNMKELLWFCFST